ncbi:MAG TPA: deoxyribodipyrimidine photo-lyase [Marmoricola sp.]|nr:deoxyribodipyrimidine photo-lyase [Marmoricola sp.]
MTDVALALFTRDLRVHDNPVLVEAAKARHVVPLFVLDEAIAGFRNPNKAAFLRDCLEDLDAELQDRGAGLVVRRGHPVEEVRRLAARAGAEEVHVAADVSGYAQAREQALAEGLEEDGRRLVVHDGSITAVPPGAVTPSGKDHAAVFTPYYRRWARTRLRTPLAAPRTLTLPDGVTPGRLPDPEALGGGPTAQHLPRGGEREARRRLAAWVRAVEGYADGHDDLAGDRTSRLSPYLHFGCLSPAEVVARVGRDGEGAEAFVRQIAWRDFHHQMLAARPEVSVHDYRPRDDRWRRDEDAFGAWCEGRTGYPIVDAGMRQLAAEGWMHNRARLLVASFLTKTLYLDWRLGARHFLDHLLDGDVANNQLNWQWVAGTGADTRPNRVLNPLRQAERFDPEGEYVRRYVPELRGVEGSAVHQPWKLPEEQRRALDYPDRIVDHDEAAAAFRQARS